MPILWLIVFIQILLAVRVIMRMLRSASGTQVTVNSRAWVPGGSITVVVPVLNEFGRLGTCLEKLIACGREVREILVVDGGSTDGTQKTVASFAAVDARVRAIAGKPIPPGWRNAKAWGLECGLLASSPDARWIVTMDADVRPRPPLLGAMVEHAQRCKVAALSVVTKHELGDLASGVVHPSMLATLVYRYGLPGKATSNVSEVQANGQCFLARRDVLIATNAFAKARTSVCEDVTIARILARAGHRVGFYDAGDLVVVRMYETWREAWQNWPRSRALRDSIAGRETVIGLAEVLFVQALPLILLFVLAFDGHHSLARTVALTANTILLILRIDVLVGTRRAYRNPAWTCWLSLFADLPVAAGLLWTALRRRRAPRGRAPVLSKRITRRSVREP